MSVKAVISGSILFLLSISAFAQIGPLSICGDSDERITSKEPEVGRLQDVGHSPMCTGTMISSTCMVTAGHCVGHIDEIAFNVPKSSKLGNPKQPEPEHIYPIDLNSIQYTDGGPGNDWAVMRINPQSETGLLAGDVQGYLPLSYEDLVKEGDYVHITGYGIDDGEFYASQQIDLGPVVFVGKKLLYNLDTMGGNSGSSVVHRKSGQIVGIHTHGGCNSLGGNQGTYIAQNEEFQKAITYCLQTEETDRLLGFIQ